MPQYNHAGESVIKVKRRGNRAFDESESAGLRPSFERLLRLVDTTDDAWPLIAGILREMTLAGAELDEAVVVAAVKLGHRRWGQAIATLPANRYGSTTLAVSSDEIVYYIRRGDLIKIGTTTDPAGRFESLMPDEILAFEPGGQPDETFRHYQFAHLRRQGEHFMPEPELLYHIQQIRALYGDPDPSWPTIVHQKKMRGHEPLAPPTGERTICGRDAETILGIKENTLRGWVFRGRIAPIGRDEQERQLFDVGQLLTLRDLSQAWRTKRETCRRSG